MYVHGGMAYGTRVLGSQSGRRSPRWGKPTPGQRATGGVRQAGAGGVIPVILKRWSVPTGEPCNTETVPHGSVGGRGKRRVSDLARGLPNLRSRFRQQVSLGVRRPILRLFPIRERCIMFTCALSPSKRFACFGNSTPMLSKPSRRGIVTPSAPPGKRLPTSEMCTAMRAWWAIIVWSSIFGTISTVWWWPSIIRLASSTFALLGRIKTTTRSTWLPFKRTSLWTSIPFVQKRIMRLPLQKSNASLTPLPIHLRGTALRCSPRFVEAYEEQHYSISAPDPIEAIKYYMESRGLCRRDLEPYLGSRAGGGSTQPETPIVTGDDPSSPYGARDWGRDSHPVVPHGRSRAEQGRTADAEKPPLRSGFPARLRRQRSGQRRDKPAQW